MTCVCISLYICTHKTTTNNIMIDIKKYSVDFLQGIKIDTLSEIPQPLTRQGIVRGIYEKMNDGDSVLIKDYYNAMSVRAQMGRISNESNDGFRVTFRTVNGGYRIFKVKK